MIALTLTVLALFVLYFLPSVVAAARDHRQRWAIFVVNLFFGWTAIGWVLALAWSATEARPRAYAAR